MADFDIMIVGAGIGGLTAALALRHFGFSPNVIEQADFLGEIGAGIQISPNGFYVLHALGLGPDLDAASVRAQSVCLRDHNGGHTVARLNLARFGSPVGYRFFHRADLLKVLIDACDRRGISITTGCHVDRVKTENGMLETSQGSMTSDIIIGADGIHSKTRGFITGDVTKPTFTGEVAWRALVPNRINHPNDAWVHMGPHRHIVTYPLRGGDILNVVMVQEQSAWARDGWHVRDDPQVVQKTFSDFSGPIADVLRDLGDVHKWGLFRHPVAAQWSRNRLVMLGDAAHPTLPFMAQGAVQAIEDAWALAASLAKHDTPQDAFSAYQSIREARVRRVIATANGNAWKYHLAFVPLRFGAHTALRLLNAARPQSMVRQFDWIYNYDVTKAV
jgi:salicylate hydroxylase